MSRIKKRSAFDHVSEFDRGRIVVYRDCGLSFRELGSRVGRNQTTVMRICDLECRRVRRTDEVDHIHLTALLHQSGLSARRPLLGLPLTQNHRRLRHQWCDGRRMWVAERNEVVFTNESRICLQHQDGRILSLETPLREDAEQLRYAPPNWSGTRYYGIGNIRYHSRTSLVRIAGTLNSQRDISELL
ncbi:transposable element Tcb1 transposase [Trichonephila clavipes]|uniref:Transposable element Tcb1 transposase n=1 Tax=Trichonephila clavipes TaxID=2585209 RepID=A0A8X6SFV0_TRICX|nr:transposable element Tcb1 transposase [Trichonephila clavipes]